MHELKIIYGSTSQTYVMEAFLKKLIIKYRQLIAETWDFPQYSTIGGKLSYGRGMNKRYI